MASSGYSQTPLLLKGAIIQFGAPTLAPQVPNVILFQYNPETLTRTLTPWKPLERKRTYDEHGGSVLSDSEDKELANQLNALAQPFDPQETFSLVLELDATDALEEPELHPIAVASGVSDRLA